MRESFHFHIQPNKIITNRRVTSYWITGIFDLNLSLTSHSSKSSPIIPYRPMSNIICCCVSAYIWQPVHLVFWDISLVSLMTSCSMFDSKEETCHFLFFKIPLLYFWVWLKQIIINRLVRSTVIFKTNPLCKYNLYYLQVNSLDYKTDNKMFFMR